MRSRERFSSWRSKRQALKREEDKASKERLTQLDREIQNLKETSHGLKAHWNNEKESIQRIRLLKEKIEVTKVDEQKAQREGDLNRAAELRYGTLTQLQKELEEANLQLAALQKDQKMLKEEVDAEDVAQGTSPSGPVFRFQRCSRAIFRSC